jgi:hypothetical protein
MSSLYEQIADQRLSSAIAALKTLCGLNNKPKAPQAPSRSELDYSGKVMYLDTKRPGIFDLSDDVALEEAILHDKQRAI